MVEAVVESAAKPRRGNRIIGEVRNLRERQETDNSQKNWTIWSFRVESFDRAGNRLQPVPVEMRARSFRGTLSEGDQVEIRGRWREGQTLRVKEAYNATTRTRVKARGNGASIWFWNIVFFIVAGLALILFCGVLDQASSGWF